MACDLTQDAKMCLMHIFCLREGKRQMEMLAFPFAAAHEPAEPMERALSGLHLGLLHCEL